MSQIAGLAYDLSAQYIQGSEMYVADALSRATVDPPEEYLGQEWLIYDIKTITNTSTDMRLGEFKAETARDQELQSLAHISGVAGGGVCVLSEEGRGSGGCGPGKIFHFPPRNNGVL